MDWTVETIRTVSKKKSNRKLSNVLNLPDLVVDKIFSSVEESYNIYFDLNCPEEISWLFEDQAEEVAEVCYSITSKFYEFMLCIAMHRVSLVEDEQARLWSHEKGDLLRLVE